MIVMKHERETRTHLEAAIVRASARVEALAQADGERDAVRAAQDELSRSAASLARYLLATGEGGWLRVHGRRRSRRHPVMNLGPVELRFPASSAY